MNKFLGYETFYTNMGSLHKKQAQKLCTAVEDHLRLYKTIHDHARVLSKPQPNLNTTVGFDNKMTLQTPPPPPHKLNISNISAVTDPILMKL